MISFLLSRLYSCSGPALIFGGPVQNKKWRPLFTIKIQDTSSIHHKNCYINHLPRKSSSSPFGIPRSNSSASMRASGRRKTGSVVFPHGPRQLIIASPRRNCRNEETMVNMINGLISILGPCLFPRTFFKSLSHQKESYYFEVSNKICL